MLNIACEVAKHAGKLRKILCPGHADLNHPVMKYTAMMKELFFKKTTAFSGEEEAFFEFARSSKAIVRELLSSKESGSVVGIYSAILGDGMFLTGVEDLYQEGKITVAVFHRYDLSGQILNRNHIAVEEIRTVCSFCQRYRNPFFEGNCVLETIPDKMRKIVT